MKNLILILCLYLFTISVSAAYTLNPVLPEIKVKKTGMLVGIQKGTYFGIEMGMERQWKKIKLKNPQTFAIAATGEYQFEANTIGFKAGPWVKYGRMNFTYGVNATLLSDFTHYKMAISPAIGFKIIGFHLLASYNISTPPSINFDAYNRLHLSVRYYISKDREFKIERKNKKKKD